MKRFFLPAALLIILSGTGHPDTVPGTIATTPNDLARFLAGMPVSPQGPLHHLTGTECFKEHAKLMNRFWSEVLRENIFNMVPWRNQYVLPNYDYGTAFYPLSGGDFINLYLLYPLARRYVMVSLEPAGKVPDPLAHTDAQLRRGLRAIRASISNIAAKNYMMSAVMKHEMKNPIMEGTLPTLLLLAARLELDLLRIEPVGMTAAGEIVPLDMNGKARGETPYALGNRIIFKSSPTGPDREILYISLRLKWDSMSPTSPEGKFFATLGSLNVIIKSAFYLLHRPSFEEYSRALLARTRLLIQDDSGLPYRMLVPGDWDTSLFGYYSGPLALRDMKHPVMQPELAADYKVNPLPLPFHFGYGVWRYDRKSNLIMSVRKSGSRPRR